MKRPIRPYKAHALREDGTRVPIDARAIVVELEPGVEIELDLAPHPRFAGHLVMCTPSIARLARGRRADFRVAFGATNVVHVVVEPRGRRQQSARKG